MPKQKTQFWKIFLGFLFAGAGVVIAGTLYDNLFALITAVVLIALGIAILLKD